MDLVGGHPYLIRLALYHLAQEKLTIKTLIKEAVTDSGIYQKHLRRHLEILQSDSDLSATFKKVLNNQKPIVIQEQKTRFQLEGMGLINIYNNTAIIKYKLYQLYFATFIN